jgi:hypothetical protein
MQLDGRLGLDFQTDGFVVVRDVLSRDEVRDLRAAIDREAASAKALGHVFAVPPDQCSPAGDILGREGIGHLIFDPRILRIARALIGREELVYFGDSGIMIGGTARGFHKDNSCRDDATHSDWRSPYTMVRFGIYLEDHDQLSGGLKVRRGSHLHADDTSGEIVDVPTRAGDVVVWSLRTTHSGHAVRVRGLPFLHLQPRFEARTPEVLRAPEPCERKAIFMTFGCDDAHLEVYLEKHRNLETYPENYLYKSWLYSAIGEPYESAARAAGVRLVRATADYGSKFRSTEPVASGKIPVGRGKPDVYPAKGGVEVLIRSVGKVARAAGLARS